MSLSPPPRSRGAIALRASDCTSCLLCVKECPDACISLDAHPEQRPAQGPRGRPRTVAVLDAFSIDWSLCMYCGICVEVCPFDALFWTPEHSYPAKTRHGLVHGIERLEQFLDAVPEPAPLDPAALPTPLPPARTVSRGR